MVTLDNGTVTVFKSNGLMKVCVSNQRVGSMGMWYGDDPLDYVFPNTMVQIILAIATSHLLYFVLRPLRTPTFVCSLMSGIILGPSFLGQSLTFREQVYPPRQAQYLVLSALVGAVYYVFLAALKMDLAMTLKAAKSTWKLGFIPFFCSFVVSATLFSLLPIKSCGLEELKNHTLFSVLSSYTYFPVIAEALMQLNLITSEIGQIALSAATLNDVICWIFTSTVSISKNKGENKILILFFFTAFTLSGPFIIRPVMMMIARRTPTGKPVKEGYIVMILLSVLALATIGDLIGLSVLQGPLLLGLFMPNGPPLGSTLIERSEAIINHFLMPSFFVSIGINTNLFEIQNWKMSMKFHFIMISAMLAKLIGCMLTSLTYKIRLQHGLVLGLILNYKGIIELISFLRMKQLQVIDDNLFSQLVLSTMMTTAIVSPLIEILYEPHTRLDRFKHPGQIRMIQNTPRDSELCVISCVHNEGNVRSIIAFLEACYPNQQSPMFVYVIHLIELLGKGAPYLFPLPEHKRKSLLENYPNTTHIIRAFENYSSNRNGVVNVQPYINVAPYKNMHESVCNLAQDKMIPFLVIPFHENEEHTQWNHLMTSIRDLNASFQAYAPCTVGLLVDRCSRLGMKASNFSFHVGIFFVGGEDDRESLALGIRMSACENRRITLLRFVLKNKKLVDTQSMSAVQDEEEEEEEKESLKDESLIDEFNAMKIGSDNVASREIVVEDGVQALEAIRGLQDNYDLLMVGRRQNLGFSCDEELSNFIENAEALGMVGDMLASIEFCNGLVPVLVMQSAGGQRKNRLDRAGSNAASLLSFGSKKLLR